MKQVMWNRAIVINIDDFKFSQYDANIDPVLGNRTM
jgi:hypothetical protein